MLQRNKVLEHLVQVHVRHQQLLRMDAQAMPAQQHLLLGELAAFLNMVEGDEACCPDAVQQWPLAHFLDAVFPVRASPRVLHWLHRRNSWMLRYTSVSA